MKLKELEVAISNNSISQTVFNHTIYSHHFNTNPWYKNKSKNCFIENWNEIPIMNKKEFQSDLKNIISSEFTTADLYIANTSGSSGHPFYFAKDKMAHSITWANMVLLFEKLDISVFNYQARFYGMPATGLGRWKEIFKDFLMNRFRFDVFDLSETSMSQWIHSFSRRNFVYINGYTSVIVFFARYLLGKSIILKDLCPSLQYCLVTAETCTDEDKAIISSAFGIKVLREYGASEVGVIAMENLDEDWVVCSSNIFLEVVDENGITVPDGIEGKILVTDLHNKAMPFIRYEIGDIGALGISEKGERVIISLTGRTNDFIILPSGKKSAGLTFYYISRSLLERGGFLKEFVIRQTELDFFVFDLVSDRDLTSVEMNEIQFALDKYLEPGLRFEINRVLYINRIGSGKIKHFFSEVQCQKSS